MRTPVREEPQARAAPPSPMPVRTPRNRSPRRTCSRVSALRRAGQHPLPQRKRHNKCASSTASGDRPPLRHAATDAAIEANFGESPRPTSRASSAATAAGRARLEAQRVPRFLSSEEGLGNTPVERRLRQACGTGPRRPRNQSRSRRRPRLPRQVSARKPPSPILWQKNAMTSLGEARSPL